jgi:DNA primase
LLKEIKKELLNQPEKLKEVLEHYNFHNVIIHQSYISFGRSADSSKKSIVIRLTNNDYLYVKDYARNIQKDLFTYIGEQRLTDFSEILSTVKSILNITDYYDFFGDRGIFGGFYERIRKRNVSKINTYDESLLDNYKMYGNARFVKDHISIDAQQFFGIRYDVESQGIVIPIRNQLGQLMGVKVRCNYEVEDGEMKYYYLIPCAMSQTLYGYSQNYNYLVDNTVYILESEKSVMQCYSYGIRNCVALGSGSISNKQVQMLFELNPKRIIFLHDTGFKQEYFDRNIAMIKNYSRFSEVEIGYWDYIGKNYEDKVSPSDLGKDKFKQIINTEIKMIGDEFDEDEL